MTKSDEENVIVYCPHNCDNCAWSDICDDYSPSKSGLVDE
jgi:hypothetical protein